MARIRVGSVQTDLPGQPQVQAPAAAFGPSGEGLMRAGAALSDVMQRIDTRNAVNDQIRIEEEFRAFGPQALQSVMTTSDIASGEALTQYDAALRQESERLLQAHRGTPDTRARLEADLERHRGAFFRTALKAHVETSMKRTNDGISADINELVGLTRGDPSQLVTNIETMMDQIAKRAEVLTPDQQGAFVQTGVARIVEAAIQAPLIAGDFLAAEEVLNDNPALEMMMGHEHSRTIRGEIDAAKRQRAEIQREAEKVFLTESAKYQARTDHLRSVMESLGLNNQARDFGTPVDVPSVAVPFGPDVPASADMQDAMRLFHASRALALAGESPMAGNLMSQARFIIENSTDISRSRELDRPLDTAAAAEFGVPVGTTMREVLGQMPRSPEERAGAITESQARSREKVKAEQQLAFVNQAQAMLETLQHAIAVDERIVGVGGSLRRAGQNVQEVLRDLGMTGLLDSARNIAFGSSEMSLVESGDLFDFDNPNLSTLSIIENSVGMILARLRTPEGRVPVDVIKRSIEDVRLTGFTGTTQVQNRLDFIMKMLDTQAKSYERLYGIEGVFQPAPPSDTPEAAAAQIAVPRYRIEGGSLVRITETEGAEE